MAGCECVLEKFVSERAELLQHAIETAVADGVAALGRRRYRREADFVESDVFGEMAEDAEDVESLRGQGNARADRTAAMLPQQLPNLRSDDVVAANAAFEDAELVLHLLGTVDRDGHAALIVEKPLDDLGPQQRGVGGKAEVHVLAQLFRAAPCIRSEEHTSELQS